MAKNRHDSSEPDQRTSKIAALMFGLSRHMLHSMKKQDTFVPLSFMQVEAMRKISTQKKTSMKDLAEYLEITPPSATSLADGLAKQGYVSRTADPKDRRAVYLSLTGKGKKFTERSCQARVKMLTGMIKNLSEQEQKNFISILEKLINNNH